LSRLDSCVIHEGVMENVGDTPDAARKIVAVFVFCANPIVRGHYDIGAARHAVTRRMVNGRVNCLDGPDQHREHENEKAPDQNIGLGLLKRLQSYTISLARR
jgi:hypothetical protein